MFESSIVDGIEYVFPMDSNDLIIRSVKEDHTIPCAYNIDFIKYFADPDDGYIIDAGCHIGTYSLPLAKDGYNVIAIDACIESIQCLNASINMNNIPNILTINACLSDCKQLCSFNSNTDATSAIDLNPLVDLDPLPLPNLLAIEKFISKPLTDSSKVTIETSTLDDIIGTKNCSLIKLDVEGHEKEVLMGSTGIIKNHSPSLLIEINTCLLEQNNTDPREIFKVLDDLSYDIFICTYQGSADSQQYRLQPIKPTDIFPFCVIDVLCLHNTYDKSKLEMHDYFTVGDIADQFNNPKIRMYDKESPCYSYFDRAFSELINNQVISLGSTNLRRNRRSIY